MKTRILFVAAALCLPGIARAEDPPAPAPPDPPVAGATAEDALPVAASATEEKAPEGTVVLDLDARGEIRRGGKVLTLSAFRDLLWKEIGEGQETSDRIVLVRADRDAPWMHVQWLLLVCAQGRFPKVQFAVKRFAGKDVDADEAKALGAVRKDVTAEQLPDARLPAHLPVDAPVGRQEIKVSIHIVARKEVEGRWRGMPVMMPTEFRYRFADRETTDLDTVRDWVREAKRAAGAAGVPLVGEIKAGHKVPFGRIVSLLDAFHASGIGDVQFYGTPSPTEAQLKQQALPYPTVNYGRVEER